MVKDNVLPDIWFGQLGERGVNWRNLPDEPDSDDEELEETPADVVLLLGFDPKEFGREEKQVGILSILKGGAGSGNFGHGGRPGEVGGSSEEGGGKEKEEEGGKKGSAFSDKVKVRESKYSGHLTSELGRISTDYPNAVFHGMIDENPLIVSVTDKLPVGRFGENGYMPSGSGVQFIKISTACFVEGGSKELGQATLRHELGHYILRNLDDADEKKVKELYEKHKDTIRFSSDLKANFREVFAESFARVTDTKQPGQKVPPDIQNFIKSRILK